MAWAKLWTDILGDTKLMRAARKGARNLQLTPWLFAFAKEANDNGRLTVGGVPADPEDIANLIPCCRPRDVTVACIHLLEIRVLVRDSDGAYRFLNWGKRQGRTPPSDEPEAVTERVRRHRARKRNGVTETMRNGVAPESVTTPEKEEEKEKEKETETETEKDEDADRSAASGGFRATLLGKLPSSRSVAMGAALRMWEAGDDLPNTVAGLTPTREQIEMACRDVMASCELGTLTVNTMRAFLVRAMKPDRQRSRRGPDGWDEVVAL